MYIYIFIYVPYIYMIIYIPISNDNTRHVYI